ncbi:MAG: sulfotransferase [Phycisphaerales bacterium]|nr:sulfotransferase [Phycisphaerales bacterium]MCB9836871.1 sulfotransferase [Phycisphaera sp.]
MATSQKMIESLLHKAGEAQHRGDLDAAEHALSQVVKLRPSHAGAWSRLASIHQYRGDTARALAAIRKAVKAQPKDGRLQLALAECCELEGDGQGALEAYRAAAQLLPAEPRGLCGRASVLERMHMLDEARAAAEQAAATFPDSAIAATMLARVLRRQGETDRAFELLRAALDRSPKPEDEYPAAFELGRLLDKLGRYDDAFAAFQRANSAQAKAASIDTIPPDPALGLCDEVRTFTAEQFTQWRSEAEQSKGTPERVAFLFGFPRSGTTMTDRILGSHPDVVILEEQPTIREMHAALHRVSPDGKPIRDLYPVMTQAQAEILREAYRSAVRQRLSAKDARRWKSGELLVIDKFPLQITAIGTISRVLPSAKVMVALRDPRDACLSAFMQSFGLNRSMMQMLDLERTASYYNAVMGMWADVRERLALDWLEVRYEDTVDAFESQARRVLDFLGLPWSDALGQFHRHQPGTLVSTPSYEAVSRPINRDAIGRWKNYRPHIAELIGALAPMVKRFGYEPADA